MSKIMHMDTQYAGVIPEKDYSELIDFFYPVGCYFETSDADFDPNTAWGGTWEKETEGSALISGSASGTYRVGQSYGANSLSYTPAGSVGVTVNGHALTVNEMPSHNHIITIVGDQSISTGGVRLLHQWNKGQMIGDNVYYEGGNQAHSHSASGSFSGTAATLNVMQKSKAEYIWHRTA